MDPTRRDLLAASLVAAPAAADVAGEVEQLKRLNADLLSRLTELAEQVSWLSLTATPIGTLLPYAGTVAPDGWLICDGGVIDPDKSPEYKLLADLLGSRYDPDGKAVRLPNLQGRALIGATAGTADRPGYNVSARRLGT